MRTYSAEEKLWLIIVLFLILVGAINLALTGDLDDPRTNSTFKFGIPGHIIGSIVGMVALYLLAKVARIRITTPFTTKRKRLYIIGTIIGGMVLIPGILKGNAKDQLAAGLLVLLGAYTVYWIRKNAVKVPPST
jgi:peptidoglycan/LPS O-acetylase OafA/YrhL